MHLRRTRLAAAGLAAGAVLSLFASTGTAQAGAAEFYVSLQPNSNVRSTPDTRNAPILNTGPTRNRYYLDGVCYVHGQPVTAGGYSTDVWYQGTVHDGELVNGPYRNVWVWGGNVNVGVDPSPSARQC
ncbi:hypothetical protein [Streptomyces griseus]|uniref:hypothetical protein n=1 Tax=Streptomyces griseus TaxID=1911 RepID=UPI00055B6BFA|nr:hypothetical protein [Streptomyces griseus]